MSVVEVCWLVVAVVGLAYAGGQTWGTSRGMQGLPLLADDASPAPPEWPSVSLIVPARNEEASIGPAVRSRLAEGYPALEVVLVDDRSTDGTGAVVDALAREDGRIQPVHVQTLPPGWLGKVHALREGLRLAKGEWILFSDADVHLAPSALQKAVALAEARGLDQLAVLPQLVPTHWLIDAAMASL